MKRLTWLGIFIILCLILAACGSTAEQTEVPESAAVPVEGPAQTVGEEAAATDSGMEDEAVVDESPRIDVSSTTGEAEKETETKMSGGNTVKAIISDQTVAEAVAVEEVVLEAETIFDIAEADGRFDTLVNGLEATGLEEIFAGEGPYTVFAPTDDAFAELPQEMIDSLFADPHGALKNVLLYHGVDGVITAEELAALAAISTMAGQNIDIYVVGEGQVVLDSYVNVIVADIEASNGVIHVVDAVLIPAGRG